MIRASLWAALLALASPATAHAPLPAEEVDLNIIFIGDSITQRVGDSYIPGDPSIAPPVATAAYLQTIPGFDHVAIANHGYSGLTTVDFLPDRPVLDFVEKSATDLAKANGAPLVFSIMLGTNDSSMAGPTGAPVPVETYRKNLEAIVSRLLTDFPDCRIILHHPTWYSPNTHNGSPYLSEGAERLRAFIPQIDATVARFAQTHPHRVLRGDTKGYSLMKRKHRDYLIAEPGKLDTFYLHPNKKGAEVLGRLWGEAIVVALRKSR